VRSVATGVINVGARVSVARRCHPLSVLLPLMIVPFCKADTPEEMLSACRPITERKIADGKVYLPQSFEAGMCWGAFSVFQGETRWADETGERHFGISTPEHITRTSAHCDLCRVRETEPIKIPASRLTRALLRRLILRVSGLLLRIFCPLFPGCSGRRFQHPAENCRIDLCLSLVQNDDRSTLVISSVMLSFSP